MVPIINLTTERDTMTNTNEAHKGEDLEFESCENEYEDSQILELLKKNATSSIKNISLSTTLFSKGNARPKWLDLHNFSRCI